MAKRFRGGKTRRMQWRCARLAVLLGASLALGASSADAADSERHAALRVDAPQADAATSLGWIEVRGQAAARDLAAHDLVLVLDVSDSSLLPSGWDVDGDGPHGVTDPARIARLEAKPDFPPDVGERLRAADFDDSVLAAELAAARALLARLEGVGTRYRVGIVVFSDDAHVLAPLGASAEALDRALDELFETFYRELRGTNFGDAIGAAQLLLQPEVPGQPSGPPSGRDQSIVLLSDGAPTLPPHGDRAREHALYAASAAGAADIRLYPFELARSERRGVLAEMAERSGGRFERLERPGDAIARLRRTDLVGLADLRIVNQTTGTPARALRTFPDGSFDAFVALAPGSNRLAIHVTTTDGASAQIERVVTRSAEASAPAGERELLEELRRRTRETELWAEMERQRRGPKRELELRVEPGSAPR